MEREGRYGMSRERIEYIRGFCICLHNIQVHDPLLEGGEFNTGKL